MTQPLRIAVISKSNADGGGASRVAEDLACVLAEQEGVEAEHWLAHPGQEWREHMRALHGGKWMRQVVRGFRVVSSGVGLPDFFTPELLLLGPRRALAYDLFHVHDTSSALSPIALRWLARRRPVVWTLHDCSPFTGGCLYPMGCSKFESRCGSCPQLGVWPLNTKIDLTGTMQQYKRRVGHEPQLCPVAPSNWMADEAERSGVFPTRPRVIPNYVDANIFQPRDKEVARVELGLPRDRFLVLLSAGHLGDVRKGTAQALEALCKSERPLEVLAVGAKDPAVMAALRGTAVHSTGYVHDKHLLAKYYAAADVYLFPSLADNLPNSILETMACGTPVVGFSSGGIVDMVTHGVDGWLAPTGDVAGLVAGLQHVIDQPAVRQRWAELGRAKMLQHFSPQRFLQNHLDLYAEILEHDAQQGNPEPLRRAA